MSGQQSGVTVYGEQRGAAVSDYDADGRVDLVVTQNGAETKLYRNSQAQPGLRVRLIGPKGNASGVGAVLRTSDGTHQGPAREIHAGSGYWSQDSAVQVFGDRKNIKKIFVRWPGSKSATETLIPADARELEIIISGTVKVIR